MPAEKRNDFLDVDESEDELDGYQSEEELQKGGARGAKRRKLEEDDADLSDKEDQEESADGGQSDAGESGDEDDDRQNKKKDADEPPKKRKANDLPGVSKPLTKKNLVASEAAKKKSGVIYLSRIPPFMKPQKLRSLLEPYGTINRIFLSPEDPESHKKRVRNGGNKKKSYTDGWVEFVNKKDAKAAVDLLNGRTIGGKKGSYYRDDMWCMVYLKGFKWFNLIEQISAEAAERESRMRAEISKSTKENKEFERNIEKAKVLNGIQSKAAAKNKTAVDGPSQTRSLRTFEQAVVAKKRGGEKLPEDSQRVASMLFG